MKYNFVIRPIDKLTAIELIFQYHYSKVMPKLTTHYLGAYINGDELVGVMTLGHGVRPLHTIKLLFPSLGTSDYFEIGKMCMSDEMPRNSESQFLSAVIEWTKSNTPVKLIFTWADGVLSKPGYVYQSANFKYGGFIWTDLYIAETGEKVHPRTSQTMGDKTTTKYGHRPTRDILKARGWQHIRGKQFRYVYFTCGKKEQKALLRESPMNWNTPYPKQADLEWKIQDLDTGEWTDTPSIVYNATANNQHNKMVKSNTRKLQSTKQLRKFFTF